MILPLMKRGGDEQFVGGTQKRSSWVLFALAEPHVQVLYHLQQCSLILLPLFLSDAIPETLYMNRIASGRAMCDDGWSRLFPGNLLRVWWEPNNKDDDGERHKKGCLCRLRENAHGDDPLCSGFSRQRI